MQNVKFCGQKKLHEVTQEYYIVVNFQGMKFLKMLKYRILALIYLQL